MAGSDHEIINTRERPLSTDINNLQSLVHRAVMDIERFRLGRDATRVLGNTPETEVRNVVLGGLQVVPDGNDVDVQPGALLQYSATVSPTPGSLDSNYRVAFNRSAKTQVMPSPGGTTFYLLEAQMTEVVTVNESRDVLNTSTGNFVPTLVDKQAERQITLQLLTGTSQAPAPSGGDWVPLAVIRRPGGGGAVAETDIYDVRPMWHEELDASQDAHISATHAPEDFQGGRIVLAQLPLGSADEDSLILKARALGGPGVATTGTGRRLLLGCDIDGSFDLSSAVVIDPGVTLTSNTWYYLWLCPWNQLAPKNQLGTTGYTRGIVVLSDVAPSAPDDRRSSAAVPLLPAPWATANLNVDEAICIGAVRRNSANTSWHPMSSVDGRFFKLDIARVAGSNPLVALALGSTSVDSSVLPFGDNRNVDFSSYVPAFASKFRVRMEYNFSSITSGSPNTIIVYPSVNGSTVLAADAFDMKRTALGGSVEFDVPVASQGKIINIWTQVNGGAVVSFSSIYASVVGWEA